MNHTLKSSHRVTLHASQYTVVEVWMIIFQIRVVNY